MSNHKLFEQIHENHNHLTKPVTNLGTKLTLKPTPKSVTKPKAKPKAFKTEVVSKNHGVILFNDSDLQDVLTKSGKLALSNEFQIHYWCLNLRFKAPDNSILDIAIPTCMFNYPHQVSSAHIDFELADVMDTSAAVEPIHNMKVNELLATTFKSQIESLFDVEFEAMSSNINSLHKHPGSSKLQSFSGTDLRNDIDDLGVVFPLASAKNDTPNFAGIMAIDGKTLNLAHYEYRTVNGKLGENMVYSKGLCTAIVAKPLVYPSAISQMLGNQPTDPSYMINKQGKNLPIFDELLAIFKSTNYTASTDAISSDNITTISRVIHSNKVKQGTQTSLLDDVYTIEQYYGHDTNLPIYSIISEQEYQDALAGEKKYAEYKSIPNKNLDNMTARNLFDRYNLIFELFNGKPDEYDWSSIYDTPEEMIEDIKFEIMALQVDIDYEIDDIIKTISNYNKQTESTTEQPKSIQAKQPNPNQQQEFNLDALRREQLIGIGFSMSKIIGMDSANLDRIYSEAISKGLIGKVETA